MVLLCVGCRDRMVEGFHLSEKALGDLTLVESIKEKGVEKSIWTKPGYRLQVEKFVAMDPGSSQSLVRDELLGIKALYADALSAYPGQISNTIVCPEEYQPVFRRGRVPGRTQEYVLLYATERFGLGACTQDSVFYKHLRGWLYCPMRKELYIVRYFMPPDQDFMLAENIFFSLSCSQ